VSHSLTGYLRGSAADRGVPGQIEAIFMPTAAVYFARGNGLSLR
jgi:hypothetical protein